MNDAIVRVAAGIACLLIVAFHGARPVEGLAQSGQPKWHVFVEGQRQFGNRRYDLLEGFVPFWQTAETLAFLNLRVAYEPKSESLEGAMGVGFRALTTYEWIFGGYAYFDIIDKVNFYNQAVVGIEAKNERWDVRANAYIPLGLHQFPVNDDTTFDASRANWQVNAGQEIFLKGYQVEVGYGLTDAIWLYAGHHGFTDPSARDVYGSVARFEVRFLDGLLDLQDTRMTLVGSLQKDNVRSDAQGFIGIRLRLPIHSVPKDERPFFSLLEQKMLDPVMREVN